MPLVKKISLKLLAPKHLQPALYQLYHKTPSLWVSNDSLYYFESIYTSLGRLKQLPTEKFPKWLRSPEAGKSP